ncbi:unnamed protein product [Tetraodon nigroviridis]|uniref:(spotted green pufferfish) hypothetical protein n=1 Tax=Tetraodon nigroviridis TaxID=99883 RepID=Q4S7C6_TETNG|nr:unnamed protein product [Tetraodon nigroviridis]
MASDFEYSNKVWCLYLAGPKEGNGIFGFKPISLGLALSHLPVKLSPRGEIFLLAQNGKKQLLLPLNEEGAKARSGGEVFTDVHAQEPGAAHPFHCSTIDVASVTRLPGITRRLLALDDIPLFLTLTGRSSMERGQEINSGGPPDSTGGVFKELACWTLPITKHKIFILSAHLTISDLWNLVIYLAGHSILR